MKASYSIENAQECVPDSRRDSSSKLVGGIYVKRNKQLCRNDFLQIQHRLDKEVGYKNRLPKAKPEDIMFRNIILLDLNTNKENISKASELAVVTGIDKHHGKEKIQFATKDPFETGECIIHKHNFTHITFSSKDSSRFCGSNYTEIRHVPDKILFDLLGTPDKSLPVLL